MINRAVSKFILVAGGVFMLFSVGFIAGYSWCNQGKQEAIVDQLDDDRETVKEIQEVIKWREKKVIKYVDKIKLVPADDCTDVPVNPELDELLLEAYRSAT